VAAVVVIEVVFEVVVEVVVATATIAMPLATLIKASSSAPVSNYRDKNLES
jgi:type IV secretory pathway protease TraF